jgi:hypothetical protein
MRTSACLLTLALIAGSTSGALAAGNSFATHLSGFNEVHFIAAPTPAPGEIRGQIDHGPGAP